MGIPLRYNGAIVVTALVMAACSALGQFSHKKPWPTYSLQNMPQTRFTCHDKILGGYYADPETQCQMFHVCVKVAGVGVQDFRFLCPNGTAFDQEAQICADWGDVDCEQAVLYYGSDNFDLYRLGSGFESKRAPLAEEEEATFHLQRAETGDIRRSKETRVDQKLRPESTDYTKKSEKYESTTRTQFYDANSDNRRSNYDQNNDFQRATPRHQEIHRKTTSNYYTTPRANDFHNNADSKQDADDLFKGSHSSNFFSNRNNGREDDLYDHKVTTTTTTTTTSRPYNHPNEFFNGNGPQSDYNDFNKIPDASTKRPSRGRRPIASNSNNLITNPTNRPSPPSSTTYATTVPDVPKSTRRLSVQSSFNAGFNFGNDQLYTPTTTTTTTTTQRSTSPAQKFPFGANDYQQNIQPTTYNPSGAFRYKATTSKYDDINETALRGEKLNPSAFFNSQYENQNLEIFSRVSNRKAQNSERNIQKQQAKNATLANRNEFTDFAKTKAPSGFQTPSRVPQPQSTAPVNLGPNVQPLDPSKLNSELRNINQSQPPSRGRLPISRFNDRQQNEPQYFRSKTQETPAPFAVPQAQQQQAQKKFDSFLNDSLNKDSGRFKAESRVGSTAEEPAHKPAHSTFNAYSSPQRDVSRTRPDQRPAVGTNFDTNQQPAPQRDITKIRIQQRTGVPTSQSQQQPQPSFNEFSSPQREFVRNRAEQRPIQQSQQQKPVNHFEATYNGFNNQQRDVGKNEPRRGASSNQDFDQQRSDFSSTTGASIATTPPRGRGRINYKATTQHQGRSLDNFDQSTTSALKKFSTLVPKDQYYPTTFKPTTYKKAFEQKPTKYTDPKSRGPPYTTTTTPLPSTSSQSFNTPDEDDGQYHPELYELDYTNVASQAKSPAYQKPKPTQPPQTTQTYPQSQQQASFPKQPPQQPFPNFQQQKYTTASPTDLSDEEELFKTAHSLNLGAASVNKLRADTLKTIDKTPQQSSPNFGFDRSTYPTTASPTTTWRPTTNFIATTTTLRPPSQSKKPKKSSASKRPPHADADTSYDYAYYDSLSESPQEYPEYDVISEFRKTRKH